MSLPLEDIQRAVCAWHNRHPLAERIAPEAVHSVGWVALPFMRAAQAQEPSLEGSPAAAPPPAEVVGAPGFFRALVQRLRPPRGPRGAGPWPVFSERFIEGLSPVRVAAFAANHAWAAPADNGSGWPQRRIEVDSERVEACHGAWPTEQWLVAAAVDCQGQRLRVLVGEARGRLAVLGTKRHRSRPRWMAAGLGSAVLLAAVGWMQWPARSGSDTAPPAARASGVLAGGSTASAPAAGASPPAAASAPAPAPSSAFSASAPVAAASEAASEVTSGVPPEAARPAFPPDIRPQLGPTRSRRTPREALLGKPPLLASPEAARAAAPAASAASAPYRGAADPEALRLSPAATGPLVALASPAYPSKAEAEAQLALMREHVLAVVRTGATLQGEVFETPQGWRAAVWPFGTREEAQIVNATMVARGWKTRAISF